MPFTLVKVPLLLLLCIVTFSSKSSGSPLPSPSPKPKAKSLPEPDPQFVIPGSRQQFAMYKPLQLQYVGNPYQQQQQQMFQIQNQIQQQLPAGLPMRQTASGRPLLPIFHYSYNVTHPQTPKQGIVLTHHQLQYLTLQQQEQQRQQLLQRLPQQSQANLEYAPVIIGNQQQQIQQQIQRQQIDRQQIRQQQIQQQQNQQLQNQQQQIQQQQFQQQLQQQLYQPQTLIRNFSTSGSAEFTVPLAGSVEEVRQRDPEDSGIAFRIQSSGRRKNSGTTSGGRIVFDQNSPNNQLLNQVIQYPENIVFTNGGTQGSQRQFQSPTARPFGPIQFGQERSTPPTIQVPYVTTPSPLQQILEQQRNSQITGFRSQLGLYNPGLRASSLTSLRGARVQNILVPTTSGGQTPAGTQLLKRDYNNNNGGTQIQVPYQNHNPANVVFTNQNQNSQGSYSYINPSIANLGGTVITPEKQRNKGQLIFSDSSSIAIASAAQKIFILPPNDRSSDDDQSLRKTGGALRITL